MGGVMLDETTKTALEQNSGTIIGWLSAGALGLFGLWKMLPVFSNNMDTAAKSASIQNAMLTTLIAERDTAMRLLEEWRKEREATVRELATAQAQIAVLTERCRTLTVTLEKFEALAGPMHTHVKRATRLIEAAPSAPAPLEGEKHG